MDRSRELIIQAGGVGIDHHSVTGVTAIGESCHSEGLG